MHDRATPYPELNGVLAGLVASIRHVMGEAVAGIYLQGSFAVGDFDEHSDVDFIVILDRQIVPEEVVMLNQMHSCIYHSGPEWAKHLEGSYLTRDELTGSPGEPVWYVDHSSQVLERSDHCNTLLVRSVLHRQGVALYGPPAREFVSPVDTDDLRAEMAATLMDWGADILAHPHKYRNRFYQGFIVLSYCRMLCDYEHGTAGSKRRGADWAKQHLAPEWHDLIDRAWTCRPDPATSSRTPANATDFRRTLDFVKHCMEIQRSRVAR